jgi:hypothetical protein
MEFNRSDQRRRRVLYDEAVQQPVSASGEEGNNAVGSERKRRTSHYHTARGHQLKVSDLSPTRWWVMALCITGSLAGLAVLNALAIAALRIPPDGNLALRTALSMSGPSSLTSWACIVALFAAGLVALQIYSIRRFRRDDYRGTYRIWLVLAGLFVVGSLQPVVRLDLIAAECLAWMSGASVMSPTGSAFAMVRLFILVAIFVRMLIEMRSCRLGTCLLAVAVAVLGLEATGEFLGASQWQGVWGWLYVNLPLAGCLALLNAVLAYSRFVGLDASGRLKRRTKIKRRRKTKSARSKRRRTRSAGTRPSVPATAASAVVTSAKPSGPSSDRDPKAGPLQTRLEALRSQRNAVQSGSTGPGYSSSQEGERRLSKSERRRLKKLQRRDAA